MPRATPAAELPVLLCEHAEAWSAWLAAHHAGAPGVWLRFAKQGAALRSVSYAEALDAALCYGWIDGQLQAYDAASWLRKFTPRGAKSTWSKVNRDKVAALTEAGRMRPAGLAAVAAARAEGRSEAAYDSARPAAPARAGAPNDGGVARAVPRPPSSGSTERRERVQGA